MHENWIEAMQYLHMEPLLEQKKEARRRMGMRGKKVPPLLTKGRGLNRRPKNDFAELDEHN
jgi:hypothetical protein